MIGDWQQPGQEIKGAGKDGHFRWAHLGLVQELRQARLAWGGDSPTPPCRFRAPEIQSDQSSETNGETTTRKPMP